MGLLFESKRFWLLSYVICLFIPGTLYYCFWGNSTAKTIGLMFVQVQIIMFIFFWLILVIKWKLFCRVVAALFYLGITIYEGVNGNSGRDLYVMEFRWSCKLCCSQWV